MASQSAGILATLNHPFCLVHSSNLKHCVHQFRTSQSHGTLVEIRSAFPAGIRICSVESFETFQDFVFLKNLSFQNASFKFSKSHENFRMQNSALIISAVQFADFIS